MIDLIYYKIFYSYIFLWNKVAENLDEVEYLEDFHEEITDLVQCIALSNFLL